MVLWHLRTSWLSIFERFCRIIFNIHAQACNWRTWWLHQNSPINCPTCKWVQPTVHRAIRAKHKRIRVLLSLYHSYIREKCIRRYINGHTCILQRRRNMYSWADAGFTHFRTYGPKTIISQGNGGISRRPMYVVNLWSQYFHAVVILLQHSY